MRDLLAEDGGTPFRKCSQESERATLGAKLDETFAWLAEHGDDAGTGELRERRAALEKELDDLRTRYKLLSDRATFTFNAKADGTCIAF